MLDWARQPGGEEQLASMLDECGPYQREGLSNESAVQLPASGWSGSERRRFRQRIAPGLPVSHPRPSEHCLPGTLVECGEIAKGVPARVIVNRSAVGQHRPEDVVEFGP